MNGAAELLQAFIAYGVIITCVALCGLAGLRLGLFRSILNFASFVAAALASFLGSDIVGTLLQAVGCPAAWALLAGYVATFVGTFSLFTGILRLAARAEVMTYPGLIDRVGGVSLGLLNGVLLANMVRIGFAMTPLAAGTRPAPEEIRFDMTSRMLQMAARIVSSNPDARRAWLFGEQGEKLEVGAAGRGTVWSEPFVDENANGLYDRDEPFLDKDASGRFTSSFAAADLNHAPAVGVMERYWLGNWPRVMVITRAAGEPAPRADE
jgi:hypothetical protein